jgi:hypothetical protein
MKMKKIISSIIFVLLLVGIVFAQDNDEANEVRELNSFQNGIGAQVRFLQLSYAIERNILKGETIIEKILEVNDTADVSRLNEILDEYQLLIDEIDAVDYNQSNQELVDLFLDIKYRAKNLSTEFREIAHDYLSEELKLELRNQFKQMNKTNVKIRNKIHEYNAERAKAVMKMLGKEDDLSQKIQQGLMTKTQVMNKLHEKFSSMGEETQRQAILRAQEKRAVMQVASSQYMQKYQERKQLRTPSGEDSQTQESQNQDEDSTGSADGSGSSGPGASGSGSGVGTGSGTGSGRGGRR